MKRWTVRGAYFLLVFICFSVDLSAQSMDVEVLLRRGWVASADPNFFASRTRAERCEAIDIWVSSIAVKRIESAGRRLGRQSTGLRSYAMPGFEGAFGLRPEALSGKQRAQIGKALKQCSVEKELQKALSRALNSSNSVSAWAEEFDERIDAWEQYGITLGTFLTQKTMQTHSTILRDLTTQGSLPAGAPVRVVDTFYLSTDYDLYLNYLNVEILDENAARSAGPTTWVRYTDLIEPEGTTFRASANNAIVNFIEQVQGSWRVKISLVAFQYHRQTSFHSGWQRRGRKRTG